MQLQFPFFKLVAALIVAVLLANLFQIQVIEGREWADIADNNRFRHLVPEGAAGRIFTADGVGSCNVAFPAMKWPWLFERDPAKRQLAIDIPADFALGYRGGRNTEPVLKRITTGLGRQ